MRRSPLDRFAAVVGGVGGLLDGRSGGLRSGIGLVQLFCWIGCRRERSGLFLRRFPLCGGGLVGRRESYYINLVLGKGEGEPICFVEDDDFMSAGWEGDFFLGKCFYPISYDVKTPVKSE